MFPLTRRPGGVQAFKMVIAPDVRHTEQRSHEGYEWMYVLNGRLRLLLGELDLVLQAGRGRRVRHPHPALVRLRRHPRPSSCWCCSARRANACTSAPARAGPRPVRPGHRDHLRY